MVDTVKKALRFTHDELNEEIERLIETAYAEMYRAGVSSDVVEGNGSLVKQAAVTFCLMNLTEDTKLIDKYQDAFGLQLDHLRKSTNVSGAPEESE